jgi:methylenetetrahydrofolate--tRNA-(uracil-5-)-methyltransferase
MTPAAKHDNPVHVIGAGLAGSEAAWQLASRGVRVVLHEMRPVRTTEAHVTDSCAELVCSNSFRSDDATTNAVGLLHEELRRLDSLIMRAADLNKVPAGGALAVDRHGFSAAVQAALERHPLIELHREEVAGLPPPDWRNVIVATGPLTSTALADGVRGLTGQDSLAFFDAIAPIAYRDTIDMSVAWFQSRYDKVGPGGGDADYINCPMTREQYEAFVDALLSGEKASFREWETSTPYFDGCLPVEIMAEQVRIFRTIPGLANAEFARLGGLHRNTFLNSPVLLDGQLRLNAEPRLRFAGQMTGCEGYVESASVGLLAGLFAAADASGTETTSPPPTTALGSLLGHITGGHIETIDNGPRSFQPMNINFGLFPPLVDAPSKGADGKRLRGTEKSIARKRELTARALRDLDRWIAGMRAPAAA